MTEKEWQNAYFLYEMLEYLQDWGSPRQWRLFAVACCRCASLQPTFEAAVAVAERYADGLASDEEMELARDRTEFVEDKLISVLMGRDEDDEHEDDSWLTELSSGEVQDEWVFAQMVKYATARYELDARGCIEAIAAYDFEDLDENLVREIFGNPWRALPQREFPADIRVLAQRCYDGEKECLRPLATYFEGLGDAEVAAHLRQPNHVKGCHVIDWILNKSQPITERELQAWSERDRQAHITSLLAGARPGERVRLADSNDPEFRRRLIEERNLDVMRVRGLYVMMPAEDRVRKLVEELNASTREEKPRTAIALRRLLAVEFKNTDPDYLKRLKKHAKVKRR